MQNWDRLVAVLIGSGVALCQGAGAWRAWRRRHFGDLAGHLLLAIATVALPLILALLGD